MINKLIAPIAARLESNRLERIWKLALVDFKKRYYNDRLGLVWALLHPLLRIAVYFIIFKYVFSYRQDNYGIFLFAGLILWMFFIESTKGGLTIFRRKRYLIESIQVNKLDLFFSHILGVAIGFLFNLASFLIIMICAGILPSWDILWLPSLILNVMLLSFGGAMILAIIGLYFNDITHAWDIVALFGFWTAGIFFRVEDILKHFPWMKWAHPFLGIVHNSRNVTMYGEPPAWDMYLYNWIAGLIMVAIAMVMYYAHNHKVLERL